MRNTSVFLSVLCLIVALCAAPAMADGAATVQLGTYALNVQANVAADGATVRISGPGDFYLQREMNESSFSIDTTGMVDGLYTYEVTLHPQAQRASRDAQQRARQSNNTDMTASGYFRVAGGSIVQDATEESADKAQTFATDLIVQGSACVGTDCTTGESFGFDTFRLKENNLRIHFDDTSSSGTFPNTDWRIAANDSNNGGANYLRVEDATNSKVPFTIEAGAQNNTLYVEADGDVGIKTANPVVDLHIVEGNTPTLRLEQDGSDGFTAQTWDVAGNEANFFIRDVTHSSRLPLRIEPNAGENSIYIDSTSNIGFGTNSPATNLHLRVNGNPEWRMENSSTGDFWTTRLNNSGSLVFTNGTNSTASIQFVDDGEFRVTPPGGNATFQADANGDLRIRQPTDALTSTQFFFDASTGSLTISGDLIANGTTYTSDVNKKQDFESLNNAEILAQVMDLEISKWSFKADETGARHIGPMAQDFHAAFGLGKVDNRIDIADITGVSLAAIQELNNQLQSKTEEVENLKQRMEQLEAALLALQQQ